MDSRIAEENALCFDFLILNVFDDGCDYHCDYDFDHNDQQNYYFKLKLFKLTFKVDYEKLIITITLTEFYLHFFDGAERVTLFDILTLYFIEIYEVSSFLIWLSQTHNI
ncbi:hypothetical protein T4B_10836 [Trichinella pseudospiralis]|uniref:Uncharacterized protein n=1 Tax=Trichinella pseudospiralis TaxID=6337 RepID=A0A0V1J2I6_TRIPS|nr:hypothetical protein T4A_3503 [Trichinella pseudospiralis]KRZ29150.1 hypothetical protein T4B_10836 [Trichinella pseudospiralis]